MTADKELKRTLRALRKLKKETQIHTEQRRQINKQIRELKEKMGISQVPDEDKQKLIDEITELKTKRGEPIYVDLKAYDAHQLQVHLNHIKSSRGFN